MTTKLLFAAALLATTTLAGVTFAQVEFDQEKVCAAQLTANTAALEAARAARPDAAAVRELVVAAASRATGNNVCLANLLNAETDSDIAEVLAQLADSGDIAPAAGPEGDTPDFGGDAAPVGENPSQLNQPVAAPASSPSAPELR